MPAATSPRPIVNTRPPPASAPPTGPRAGGPARTGPPAPERPAGPACPRPPHAGRTPPVPSRKLGIGTGQQRRRGHDQHQHRRSKHRQRHPAGPSAPGCRAERHAEAAAAMSPSVTTEDSGATRKPSSRASPGLRVSNAETSVPARGSSVPFTRSRGVAWDASMREHGGVIIDKCLARCSRFHSLTATSTRNRSSAPRSPIRVSGPAQPLRPVWGTVARPHASYALTTCSRA